MKFRHLETFIRLPKPHSESQTLNPLPIHATRRKLPDLFGLSVVWRRMRTSHFGFRK